jgi:hypothetical protein
MITCKLGEEGKELNARNKSSRCRREPKVAAAAAARHDSMSKTFPDDGVHARVEEMDDENNQPMCFASCFIKVL